MKRPTSAQSVRYPGLVGRVATGAKSLRGCHTARHRARFTVMVDARGHRRGWALAVKRIESAAIIGAPSRVNASACSARE